MYKTMKLINKEGGRLQYEFYSLILLLFNDVVSTAEILWHGMKWQADQKW
jgi:hypothetical protein